MNNSEHHESAAGRPVANYFDSVAPNYLGSLPSRWLKFYESIHILRLLPTDLSQVSVLEIGCGTGYYTRLVAARFPRRLTAIDISQVMLAKARIECGAGIDWIHEDFLHATLPSCFDYILCIGGVEFMHDPVALFMKLNQCATSGSVFLTLLPPENWAGRVYQIFHRRHGVQITLFDHERLILTARHYGWNVRRTKQAHPYAVIYKFLKA